MTMNRKSIKKIGAIALAVGIGATSVMGAVAASDLFEHKDPVCILQDAVLEPVQPTQITLQLEANTQLLKNLEVEAEPDVTKVKYTQLGC